MKKWTKEELQFIKIYFNDYPIKEISEELNCKAKDVLDQAGIMGLIQDIPDGYKKCKTCKEIKPITEFFPNKSTKDKVNCYCKICDIEKRRENAIKKKLKKSLDLEIKKEKNIEELKKDTENKYFKCSICGKRKKGSEFYFNSTICKRFKYCIDCYKQKREKNEIDKIMNRGY